MTDLITAAEESWGAPLPDWIKSLALACERSSQSKVAAQLDRSPAVVSTVLRKVYKGSYERVEERVRGVLMDGRVECPALGQLPQHECQDWREKAKDFAVGVRIEHSRRHIDRIQHGQWCEAPELGAARYRLSWHDHTTDTGVYSFCMCPGGYVLSSGTEADGLVVNGMSNYARNSPWSNAALVVTVKSERLADKDLLAGLRFQHGIEQRAFALSKKEATGREIPALTLRELLSDRLESKKLPTTSCPSQIFKADVREIFPPFIIENLKAGLAQFEKALPGFTREDALLMAPETRTSSPLTILRDRETYLSTSHLGLYPCGEGAGYAGGITSAAVDGVRVALAILSQEKLLPHEGP